MKLYHFTLLFFIFFISTVILVEMRVSRQTYVMTDNEVTENAFDDAVDAATEKLISSSAGTVAVDKEGAVEAFFTSLSASFGIVDEPVARKNLELYVPVIAVTADDGFYIWYDAEITDANGHADTARVWTDRIAYSYDDGYFIYNFGKGTSATIYDYRKLLDTNPSFYNADAKEVMNFEKFDELIHAIPSSEWANCLLTNEDLFVTIKDRVVAQTLEDYLNYYCNEHNRVAAMSGVTYRFTIPDVDGTMYVRAADNASFLAFFQGYPIAGTDKTYNQYCVSNAQVTDNDILTIDDTHHYHRNGCTHIGTVVASAYTERECAMQGAYACEYCFPNTGAHD